MIFQKIIGLLAKKNKEPNEDFTLNSNSDLDRLSKLENLSRFRFESEDDYADNDYDYLYTEDDFTYTYNFTYKYDPLWEKIGNQKNSLESTSDSEKDS